MRAVADAGCYGTASELLEALGQEAGDVAARRKDWPSSCGLVDELKRLARNLRALGYRVDQGDKERGNRRSSIERAS